MRFFFSIILAFGVLAVTAQIDTVGYNTVPGFTPNFAPKTYLHPHGDGGYLYGTNASAFGYGQCAQGYSNGNSYVCRVLEVLIWFGHKNHVSLDSTSQVVVRVYPMDVNEAYNNDGSGTNFALNSIGPKPNHVAYGTLFTHDIDTNYKNFNVVTLNTQPVVSGDFAVSVDFRNAEAKGDTIAVLSDTIGAANELDFTFSWLELDSSHWFVTDFLTSIGQGGTGVSNNNLAIFPVIDPSLGVMGASTDPSIGMFPNPAVDGQRVTLTNLKGTHVKVDLIDGLGRRVRDNVGISFDTRGLSAGTYYVVVRSEKERVALKLQVH